MLLNLKSYDIEVKWKPGKTMLLADQLIRSMVRDDTTAEYQHVKIINFIEYQNVNQLKNLAVSKSRLEDICRRTDNDEEL